MGHSVDGEYYAMSDAKQAGTGADKDRSVAVLDDTGNQPGLEQVRLLPWVDLARGKEKEAGVCADPEAAPAVWKDGADCVSGGFDAQQIVMKGMAVVAIDTIEPGADPDMPAPVFGECADGNSDGHPGGIG